ncbi:DUF2971 domain-containing protein [Ruegeria conchae]|uniref:DUF2971 domain-containing protein n=1 Tax=Ruegeria conchae TaxID=981384 RepID=UPI0021A66E94|nr:DUF2971 domain-containing protein [Ruegeria conchae]UWR04243.1 DUF2971 domain-containing protein [Ruegeria conchae]
MSEPKRLYYFTGPDHALDNVVRRRLKLSFPNEVNDIFEMKPFDFGDNREARIGWGQTIDRFSQERGFISFSSEWCLPTMWGHYARNHKVVCFGFDVSGDVNQMDYTDCFVKFDPEVLKDFDALEQFVAYARDTKSKHWEYENEWRAYVELTSEEKELKARGANLFFHPFGDELRLREIIIGANSNLTSTQFRTALKGYAGVKVKTARPSFRGFKIVEQRSVRLQK